MPLTLSSKQVRDLKRWQTDFPDYAKHNLKIIDKNAEIVPFILNKAQMRVWEEVAEDLDAGRPVRMYTLKARQLGFSTLIQGIQYWKGSGTRNFGGLTISHNLDSVKKMFNKPKVFYGKSPQWLRPARKISNREELFFGKDDAKGDDIGLQSSLLITSVKDEHLAASMTLNFLHMSEFARYEAIREDIRSTLVSVLQTVPKRQGTFVFMETTAYGLGFAKEFWDDGTNGYKKIFISWIADETYTSQTPLLEEDLDDLPDGKYQDEGYVRQLITAELEYWYPEESQDKEWLEHESLCRLAWRREMIDSQLLGDAKKFNQEYPLTALEAFVTSGQNVFDTQKLSDIRHALVEEERKPEHFRWDRVDKKFYPARYGDYRVFEEARADRRYVLGADVSEGLREGDYSSAVVVSVPDFREVATYKGKISPDDFADVLDSIGRQFNLAWMCVEVNGPGIATNLRLAQRLYYPRLYWRESFDHKTKTYDRRYGFNTNKQTKNIAISDLRSFIDNDLARFTDIDTLDELLYYVFRDGKMEAAAGHTDDRVMAWAMAVQMIHNQSLLSWSPEQEDEERSWRDAPADSMFGLFNRHGSGRVEEWT
jgi:hypothetical protein